MNKHSDDLDKIVILTVAQKFKIDPASIKFNTLLHEDLKLNAADRGALFEAIEDLFGVEVNISRQYRIKTVGHICDFLYEHTKEIPSHAAEVLPREREISEKNKGRSIRSRIQSRLYKLSTFYLILFLTLYYLIIFAHWGYIIKGIAKLLAALSVPAFILYALAYLIMLAAPFSMKMMAMNRKRQKALILFSIIWVAAVLVVIFSNNNVRGIAQRFFYSSYVQEYHHIWIGLLCVLLYSYLFERIRQSESIVVFLDSFKAFPVVSPVFCFGAPAFWETSLKALGIPGQTIKPLGALSYLVGIMFLIALVLFYTSQHIQKQTPVTEPTILRSEIDKTGNWKKSKIEIIALFLIMAGLGGLTFVCVEIGFLLITSK